MSYAKLLAECHWLLHLVDDMDRRSGRTDLRKRPDLAKRVEEIADAVADAVAAFEEQTAALAANVARPL